MHANGRDDEAEEEPVSPALSQDTLRRVLANAHCDVMLVSEPAAVPLLATHEQAAEPSGKKAA